MSGRIGIDFGTSNSVVAVHTAGGGQILEIPELSIPKSADGHTTSVVPSYVHYDAEHADVTWYGAQVLARDLKTHPHTFRMMKRYIGDLISNPRKVGSRSITPRDAGADFVIALIRATLTELGATGDEEVAFSVPVESFEHYDNWLRDIAEAAGVRRFRLIDEASAAALGYHAHIQAGDVYLVFDFGGGTLAVSVVKIEEEATSGSGRKCRVLGKSGARVGGSTLDAWIQQRVLFEHGHRDSDESVRDMLSQLLVSAEAAKERLSTHESAEVSAISPSTGRTIISEVTSATLEDLLDEHGLFTDIDRALDKAIERSHDRGYGKDAVKNVLLVGGSTLIPSVRRHVVRRFGRERVLSNRPLEAVALGAAAFVSGVDFYDHIQHSYAIRHVAPTWLFGSEGGLIAG